MLKAIALALAVVTSVPVLAHAEPSAPAAASDKAKEKRGKALFEKGKKLTAQGRYTEALIELTKGYELTGRPLFLFNMAECARALGDTVQARELYEKYLAAEANGPFANAARTRLVELTPPAPEPQPEPAPQPAPDAAQPPPPASVPPPREAAAQLARPESQTVAIKDRPAERSTSHTGRNVLLVGIGVAIIAGSIGVYVATRGPDCGAGCVDLR
jgi:tetratricopeptide (TPR) repeat protein